MPCLHVLRRPSRDRRLWTLSPLWQPLLILAVGLGSMALSALFPPLQPHALVLLVVYLVAVAWCSDLWPGVAALVVSSGLCLTLHPHTPGLPFDVGIVSGALLVLLVLVQQVRHTGAQAQRERQQAQAAQQQAAEALAARDAFVSAAAHDLRLPLTNILGRADLLQMHLQGGRPLDPSWLQTQATALRYSAKRLQALVDEIADAARVQEGQPLPLRLSPVDLGTMVQAVVDQLAAPALQVTVGPTRPVQGDAARLERVLENLLGNALKYSGPEQPVTVTVGQEADWVVVRVQDRGVGIPTEEVPHVFTRYYRATTAQGIPGTGLGLAGSKRIVEQHGGYLMLESTVGKGTTVTLYLPTATQVPEHRSGSGRQTWAS